MKILSFDTSSNCLSIALSDSNITEKNIKEVSRDNIKNHNTELLQSLDNFLKENNTTLNEIDTIVLGIGPGSFTALRIVFSTIKAIAYAKNMKIIGVPSLRILYKNIENMSGLKICLIDARKSSLYLTAYIDNKCIEEAMDLTYEEFIDYVVSLKFDEVILIGDGYTRAKDFLDKELAKHNIKIKEQENDLNMIHAKNAILAAKERYEKNDFDNIFSLSPLYIRKSEAEILRDKLTEKIEQKK